MTSIVHYISNAYNMAYHGWHHHPSTCLDIIEGRSLLQMAKTIYSSKRLIFVRILVMTSSSAL